MAKVPQVKASDVEDLIMGCGQPAGEAGFNIARVVAILAGLDGVPGVTVNRYCSSSLQTIRMAAHAIKSGEGDCFIAAGVETVSRYGNGASDTAPNDTFKPSGERTALRSQGGQAPWTPQEGLPDIYISMGQTAENVAEIENVTPRADGRVRRTQPATRRGQRRERILRRRDHAHHAAGRHCRVGRRRSPGGYDGRGTGRPQAGLPAGRQDHCRQRVPTQRRCRGRARDERFESRVARSDAAGPGRVIGRVRARSRDHGPRAGRAPAVRRSSAPGLSIDDIDLVEINEAFAAQVIPSADQLGIAWDKLNAHGGSIALGHPFGMTGARIMTTLIHGLQESDGRYGLETMCVGGGQGMAMIIERL